MKLKFTKAGINGEGIGYDHRMPVFCDGVLPGETALVKITEEHERFKKAELLKVIERSNARVHPKCPHHKTCGGCSLMIAKYPEQKRIKKQLLEEALFKYGNVRNHFVRELRGSENTYMYRSQCKLPVRMDEGKLVTGMYRTGSNHFEKIDTCIVHDAFLETKRKEILAILNEEKVQAYDTKTHKGLRYLIMRSINDTLQCTLITGNDKISERLIEKLSGVEGLVSLHQSINTRKKGTEFFGTKTEKLYGFDTMQISFGNILLNLAPQSFFQLNVLQALQLYQTAVGKIDPCKVMVEAYCGIGAMSLMAADKAEKIYGIEVVPDAIANAKDNAALNHISNCEFICRDAAEGLREIAAKENVDILLADPPRSGMDDAMLDAILAAKPKKIIYISCNPATLAKNLKYLKHDYHVVTIIPFDMFPQTPQIESITVLERG